MELEQHPPEYLYEQALNELKEGHLIVAHRLLKIAVDKAPTDQRYRDALSHVQQKLSGASSSGLGNLFDGADDEEVPEIGEGVDEDRAGDSSGDAYSEALNTFGTNAADKAAGNAPSREPHSQVMRRIFPRDEAASSAPTRKLPLVPKKARGKHKKVQTGVVTGKGELIVKTGLLSLLLIASLALLLFQMSRTVDKGPFQAILPVTAAIKPGPDPELVLKIDEGAWKNLSIADKKTKMTKLLDVAQRKGYDSVFVYDTKGDRLATAGRGDIWLND